MEQNNQPSVSTPANSNAGSAPDLLGIGNTPASTPTPTNNGSNGTAWYWGDGVAGIGEKPEFFKDSKYKSVADQAKAYSELEKKLGNAPAKYEVKIPHEFKEIEIDVENPLYKSFENFARDANMSNETFNKMVTNFLKLEVQQEAEEKAQQAIYIKDEIAKLGGEKWFQERDQMKQWIQNRVPAELQPLVKEFGNSADNIKVLKWFMTQTQFPLVPPSTGNGGGIPSHELQEQMNDKRYLTDPTFQKMVDQQYKAKYSSGK